MALVDDIHDVIISVDVVVVGVEVEPYEVSRLVDDEHHSIGVKELPRVASSTHLSLGELQVEGYRDYPGSTLNYVEKVYGSIHGDDLFQLAVVLTCAISIYPEDDIHDDIENVDEVVTGLEVEPCTQADLLMKKTMTSAPVDSKETLIKDLINELIPDDTTISDTAHHPSIRNYTPNFTNSNSCNIHKKEIEELIDKINVPNCELICYADDISIICWNKDLASLKIVIEEALNTIELWCIKNKLRLHGLQPELFTVLAFPARKKIEGEENRPFCHRWRDPSVFSGERGEDSQLWLSDF
ncbi:hypothetical protein LAZ67_7002268 [Cordylochernes scorpioides]|uniref:Reverse transcriptase domain-containing protein n=1 Tax=Cordylochernes scorpioides TaxID=51811 RepID=A0ABY6KRA6_9ARAC|nr:hypothetical protein LAZ67_7002268 [Cordylochernes scorpioides]